MHENNKTYGSSFSYTLPVETPELNWLNSGFTITMYEFERTIETLWSTVLGTPTRLRVSLIEHTDPCPFSLMQIS